MTFNKNFFLGAFLSFVLLVLGAEVLLRSTVPAGFWYRHFDFSGDMTSLAELRDRIQSIHPPERLDLLLGDSVLGASALMEHRIPEARNKTLSRLLADLLKSPNHISMSLGSDGFLLPDIEGVTAEILKHPPARILLLLNFRMFAKNFNEGPNALSRNFLLGNLPLGIQKKLAPATPPTEESRLSDRLYAAMCDHWFLFREAQMAKTLWYYPSQKDFFQRRLEQIMGRNEDQEEMAEAALKLKTADYYQAYLWDKDGLPFQCLKQCLQQWNQMHIPVVVVLTPQNKKFLGKALDKPSFEKNKRALASFMKPYAVRGIRYQDWSNRYPSSFFLDHCHLNFEGNQQYAGDLAEVLKGVAP